MTVTVPPQWTVISELISENTNGRNRSGMSVTLVLPGTDKKAELGAVAWDRSESASPKKEFGDVLQKRMEDAQKAADELNKLEVEKMAKAREAMEPVRAQLQTELGAAQELLDKLTGVDLDEIERNREAIAHLSTMDIASVEAARAKIEALMPELTAAAATVTGELEKMRQVDLFRLDKARELVDALSGLDIDELAKRKSKVKPLEDRLNDEIGAAQKAIAEYDQAADEKLAALVRDTPKKML